ncbi:DUF6518 family protein [Modestobacter sp. SYSU DS0290]
MTTTLPSPAPSSPSPPAPSRGQSARWWLPVLVLVVGAGGGVLTEWAQGELADPWAAWANSVAAWCLPAFAVGALARRWRGAVTAAVATELLLVGGYYAAQAVQLLPVRPGTVVVWLVAGVVAGLVFGTAGWWWRAGGPRRAVLGLALLAGVLVQEGAYRQVHFPWQGAAGWVMVAAGLAVALLARTWRQRLAVLGVLAVVVPAGWVGTELVNAVLGAG